MIDRYEKERSNRIKAEQKFNREQREKEEDINTKIILYQIMGRIKEREKQNNIQIVKDDILLALRKNNPFSYRQYLVIWDVITNNFYQIENDKQRGRINKEDIKKAVQYIEGFSKDILPDYWKECLTA